jgi:hypothetical protein
MKVVIGVADHSGWAFLIAVAMVNGKPAIVDRRRVELIDEGLPTQPYHHETLTLNEVEAERLLRKVRQSIAARTAEAFDRLSADLAPQYQVSAIAIREPTLARLPETVAEAHRSYHTTCRADGMLYHTAICAAAQQRQWELIFHRRGEELAKAASALQASTSEVERFVNGLKQTPPWTAEHRSAFAAAIGGLRKPSRTRAGRRGP